MLRSLAALNILSRSDADGIRCLLRLHQDTNGPGRAPKNTPPHTAWRTPCPDRLLTSPLFSPRGEAKRVRSPSVQGACRSAPHFLNNAGVLEQYVEHGEQAQRSNGGLIACFDRQVARKAGSPQYSSLKNIFSPKGAEDVSPR